MIEALKSDEIVAKVGGRFKLTALIQKRMLELMDGAARWWSVANMTDLEVVIQEVLQDKIAIDYEASGLDARRKKSSIEHRQCPRTTQRSRADRRASAAASPRTRSPTS